MIKIISLTDSIKRIEFSDKLGNKCIVQCGLNLNNPTLHFGLLEDSDGDLHPQAVLTKELVEELLPFLFKFIEEGRLIDSTKEIKNKMAKTKELRY